MMQQILLHDISEQLTMESPEYWAVLPEVTDISGQDEIRLEVELSGDEVSELEITLFPLRIARPEFFPSVSGRVAVTGKGNRVVAIPFEQFAFRQMVRAFLNYLDGISIKLLRGASVMVKSIAADTSGILAVEAEITSKAGETGEWVDYSVLLTNKSDGRQVVNICQSLYGKECLPTEHEPYVILEPHETKPYDVRVRVTEDIPSGGFEKSRFLFVPDGYSTETKKIIFQTAKRRRHPYLFMKEEQWRVRREALMSDSGLFEVFRKIYVEAAEGWQVPKAADSVDYVYPGYEQNALFKTTVAWKITGNGKYLEKAMHFFEGFLDAEKGYLATQKSYFDFIESREEYARGDFKVHRAQSAGWVQEAEFFNKVAMSYDLLYEQFSDEQHRQMEMCLRNYMRFSSWRLTDGDGNNFQVAESGAGLLCALVLQDQEMVARFLYGYNGFDDLLSSVLLDDGMYFEEASGYVRLAGELFFDIVNAAENYGISLKDRKVQASYDRNILHSPWAVRETWAEDHKPFLGMSFRRFEQLTTTARCLKDYFDCVAKLLTDQGILFSVNDSNEQNLTELYQKAYYLYKDPVYKQIGDLAARPETLLVPEEKAEFKLGKQSMLMPAAGFGVLRDKGVQAALKFGGHGGYHGHFDRLSLVSYIREDTTFHNNEYAWFGYDSFLFKMWVQTSMAHNMVVVDGRMQKPSPCQCIYYEDNPVFHAVCAQTVTEWIDPPYGGQTPYPYAFPEEKCAMEGRAILMPEYPREQGAIGEYSEPIFQRRMLVLFHGYCIVWDYLEGQQEHRFDCLYHPMGKFDGKAFQGVKRERFSDDPFGAGQFIQNCYTAQMDGTVCLRFHDGQPRVNGNDIMDHMPESAVWRAWPQHGDVTIGRYPHKEDRFTEEDRRVADGYLDEPFKKTVSFTVQGTKAAFITLLEGGRSAERVQAVICEDERSIKVTECDGRTWLISADRMTDREAAVLVAVSDVSMAV